MSLFEELKRRNVIRVAILYIVASWLLLQITDVLSSLLPVPEWAGSLVVLLLVIGFPLVMIFSWVYELTPEGLKREKEVQRDESVTYETGRKLNLLTSALLVLAIVGLALDRLIPEKAGPAEPAAVVDEASSTEDEPVADTPVDKGAVAMAGAKFAPPPDRSIAVLPFVNMSGDVENEYFSDGLTEELLNVLAQIKEIKVAGRTSSFAFKGKDEDLRLIGEKLNVAHLLEGSVRKAGNRVRVTAQLIKSDDGYHLWSQTYDRQLNDVFAIQEDIAEQVVDALKVSLLGEEAARLAYTPTESAEAHDAYLLGRHMLLRNSFESLSQAEGYFKESVRLDPEYAEAWTALAMAYLKQVNTGSTRKEVALPRADEALDTALDLSPELAEGHSVRAAYHLAREENDLAARSLDRALELQPNNVDAARGYTTLMNRRGDFESALDWNARALALDPLWPELTWQRASLFQLLNRHDDALRQFGRLREIAPDSPLGYYGPALMHYFQTGRMDEAVKWYARSVQVDPSDYELYSYAALAFTHLGDFEAAEAWVEAAERVGPGQSMPHLARTALLKAQRRDDEALAMARQYVERGMDERGEDLWFALVLIRNHALETGQLDEALDAYRKEIPHYFEDEIVNPFNRYYVAADAVALLNAAGQDDLARKIGAAVLEELRRRDPTMRQGYFRMTEIRILASLGETDRALEMLRAFVDEGERAFWWFVTEQDVTLGVLMERPEYPGLIAAIKTDIDEQRERAAELGLRP